MIKQILEQKFQKVYLTTKHIKHCHTAEQPNQQLSFVFSVAQTPRQLVVELTFIDDDSTQWKTIVEQQNATIALIHYKYVTVRVNGDVWSDAKWR